ncbi:arsenic metallochaperone ArsD family protein, partial [Vibrio parahaemolyticus]|nr:arsenic metallochaperone ArsD family protein [Vibrio parahaemolyticus]
MKNIEIFDPAMCCSTIVKTKSYPTNEEFSAWLGVEISAKAQKKSGCCGQEQEKKQIVIDFLYLDAGVCKRCQGTETKLYDAINEVSPVVG